MSLALRRYCLYPIMLTKADGVPSERALQFARSSNLARRSGRISPCRATPRGEAEDQVPAEQPSEARQTINFMTSNPARRGEQPDPVSF